MNIASIISELEKFSTEIIETGFPLISQDVYDFEKRYNLILPREFKLFLEKYNGFSLMGSKILGFNRDADSIDSVYHYEHKLVGIPQYDYLVPFHNDGRGNFYCHDTRNCSINPETCPVVFWVSNYRYEGTDQPEITNESFSDFIQEVIIDWTLEEYNYDGSKK